MVENDGLSSGLVHQHFFINSNLQKKLSMDKISINCYLIHVSTEILVDAAVLASRIVIACFHIHVVTYIGQTLNTTILTYYNDILWKICKHILFIYIVMQVLSGIHWNSYLEVVASKRVNKLYIY